jgi:WD40 repeat protein
MPATRDARWTVASIARLRRRLAVGAAIVLAIGVVYGIAIWRSSWSPRAVLRGVGDTWPLAFTPDGKTFATSGTNGVTLWDTTTGRERATWPHPEGAWAAVGEFAPDGGTFAGIYRGAAGDSLSAELTDTTDGHAIWTFPTTHKRIHAVMFRDDGRQVRVLFGAGANGGELVDIDTASGREIARKPFAFASRMGLQAMSHDGRLTAGGLLDAATASWCVVVRDLETDTERTRLVAPVKGEGVSSCAFSPDGSIVGAALTDGSIALFDVATGRVKATFRGHNRGITSFALKFSPDGRRLASLGRNIGGVSIVRGLKRLIGVPVGVGPEEDAEVTVLDVASGTRVGLVESAIHPFFSPDGRTLAVRDRSLAIKLLDVPASGGH